MHEYLRAFQNIEQSVEHLLTNEYISLEINQSAKSLKQSVQPCTEELKKSAIRLKGLVKVGFDSLDCAEDICNSKQKIAQAVTPEIWEQLGELSGSHVRIIRLKEPCKKETINQAQKFWNDQIEQLRRRCFIDTKGQFKKGIGWGEKDEFIKIVSLELDSAILMYNSLIQAGLILIKQEIDAVGWIKIQEHINCMEAQAKNDWNRWENLIDEIETKFCRPTENLSDNANRFIDAINPALQALVNKKWGDIYWEDVAKYGDKINLIIVNVTNAIFDDRVNLVTQVINQAIAFYHNFLERQERYRQETPEQREAEKAWIDQQRRELERVQNGIEAILNESAR